MMEFRRVFVKMQAFASHAIVQTADDWMGQPSFVGSSRWPAASSQHGDSADHKLHRIPQRLREAKAFVSGNLLMADLKKYDIRSWTADAMVFVDEDDCSTTVFTVDLNTKTVSGPAISLTKTRCLAR